MSTTEKPDPHQWQFHLGKRRVYGHGLERRLLSDLFHHCMAMTWGRLLLWAVTYLVAVNVIFTVLYWVAPGSVTGARMPGLFDLFFFSFEVLGTVSFGGLLPGTLYGHLVATVEIFVGVTSIAVMTGLSFARFTRPKAHLLFARHPIIGLHEGKPAFILRVANNRHNFMTDAQAKIWMMGTTGSGPTRGRRFHRMTLEREDTPMLVLSWSLFHVIDEHSPLYGKSAADLEAMDAGFVVLITGHDENYGQEVRARHYYEHEELRWQHRYVDIFDMRRHDQQHVDFNLFHDTEPLAMED